MSDPVPLVRRLAPGEWRLYRDLRLRALADAPEAFGSTLERESGFEEGEWGERLARAERSLQDLPLVCELNGAPVGLAWLRLGTPPVADLYQMWVAPEARRRGAGRALLDAGIGWARARGARHITLRVTRGNASAQQFYASLGFAMTGELEPLRLGSQVMSERMVLDLS
jgi:ribosomal protein S18 acetylase RimI-like enzyme